MEKIFTPIEVNLPKFPKTEKIKFEPVSVDMEYPKKNPQIDMGLSVIPEKRPTLSEWGEAYNVSVLHQRPLSHMNHNSGVNSTMTTTRYEKIYNFFWGRWM